MEESFEQVRCAVLAALSSGELEHGAAYVTTGPVQPGAVEAVPVTSPSYVAFIDREPEANWGHGSRYLVFEVESGTVTSIESRFPPFPAATSLGWRVVYKGPAVSEAVLLIPTSQTGPTDMEGNTDADR
jgi:hypothetical protein